MDGTCLDWDYDGQMLGLEDPKELQGHTHRRRLGGRGQDTRPALALGGYHPLPISPASGWVEVMCSW